MLSHLAHHHDGALAKLLQLINTRLERCERNVDGIYDMPVVEFLLLAYVDHDGIFAVHHVHQLLSAHAATTSLGFVAHEQRDEQDEDPHQKRVVTDEIEQLIHGQAGVPKPRDYIEVAKRAQGAFPIWASDRIRAFRQFVAHMRNVTLLVVLDGFGHNDSPENNAIMCADTPNWDRLLAEMPHTLISGSGSDVGLPNGQMGNSEVGHMNLGAGRVTYQDLTRINRAIEQGEFARNRTMNAAFSKLDRSGGALHVMGLLSPGGVHSHEDQIFELCRVARAKSVSHIYLHAFLDGRDTPPKSAMASLEKAEHVMAGLGRAQIASITGRYYAMDRDNNWNRLERAYNLIVRGEAPFHAASAPKALEEAYQRGESDEFVQPTAIHAAAGGELPARLADEDVIVFMNFRADRARQLTRSLIDQEFTAFERRSTVSLTDFVMLTRYADDIRTSCAFEPPVFSNTLGEYLSRLNKTQLRIAETEKYAHVTFFFSGGREQPFEGEERILVPSPKVATYDLKPEMSASEVTDELVAAIESETYDTIICNYANGDMVGPTGVFDAAVKAVQMLDTCIGRIVEALEKVGGQMLVTADHGNVECMANGNTGQPHTAHTCELVPLLYIGPQDLEFQSGGTLSDVAPTLLELMSLDKPAEMTGRSLVRIRQRQSA